MMKSPIAICLIVSQITLSVCMAENDRPEDKPEDKPKLVLSGNQPMQTPLIRDSAYQPKVKQQMKQQQQVDFARQALAERLDIELDQIVISKVEAVTWRSGALGCPVADRMYTQALVPGLLIILSVEDKSYRYHAGQSGAPFFCSKDQAESVVVGPNDRF